MLWLRYQDMNECGLLEVPEAGDWMDLLAVRYNVLYDNVLYGAALRAAGDMAAITGRDVPDIAPCAAADVFERLNLLLWVDRCWVACAFRRASGATEGDTARMVHAVPQCRHHLQPAVLPALRGLPGVRRLLRHPGQPAGGAVRVWPTSSAPIRSCAISTRWAPRNPIPTKAIYPPIFPGNPDWREYYRSRNLNLPHQYHNGGIWPFIGGFHIAALVKMGWQQEAANLLGDLAAANQLGVHAEWEFNEWLHGETGHPMGYPYQAWSAGMYVYAYHAVKSGETPLFDALTIKS